MAYPDPKGKSGDSSMPVKQWPCPGTRSGVLRDPSDTVKLRHIARISRHATPYAWA
jgi:hypothetical protein